MEGIYKHKETGAEQVFSDATIEVLGGEKEWKFIKLFSPNSEVEQSEPVSNGGEALPTVEVILDVVPNVRDVTDPVALPVTPLDKLIEQELLPKGKVKVVSLKDIE